MIVLARKNPGMWIPGFCCKYSCLNIDADRRDANHDQDNDYAPEEFAAGVGCAGAVNHLWMRCKRGQVMCIEHRHCRAGLLGCGSELFEALDDNRAVGLSGVDAGGAAIGIRAMASTRIPVIRGKNFLGTFSSSFLSNSPDLRTSFKAERQ